MFTISGGSSILVKSSLPQCEIKLKANLQAKAVSVSVVGNPEDWFFLTSRLNYSFESNHLVDRKPDPLF